MPQVILSNGVTVQSENIRHAEFYPRGSLRSDGFISGLLIHHTQDFLFIRLSDGNTHIRGNGAGEDANALERAGVRMYRRPMPITRRAS